MFSQIFDAIEEWMRELLTGMITSNLDTMLLMSIKRPVRLPPRLDRSRKGGMAAYSV